MQKKKNVKDIQRGDKLNFQETGFEYVIKHITDDAILIYNNGDLWIPKTLIEIQDSLLSTSGYRLFKLLPFPVWWIKMNNIY